MNRPTTTIAKYGNRFWAVYQGDELICVTVYKRGALEVAQRLTPPTHEPTIQSSGERQCASADA
jgi:hypothetical protein